MIVIEDLKIKNLQQNHHLAQSIGLVMKLLNHSSEEVTLAYLGLDQETREHILDTINFD